MQKETVPLSYIPVNNHQLYFPARNLTLSSQIAQKGIKIDAHKSCIVEIINNSIALIIFDSTFSIVLTILSGVTLSEHCTPFRERSRRPYVACGRFYASPLTDIVTSLN
jgi:hypothetical protein